MKKENHKYFAIGLTIFLAIAASILFFFLLFRSKEIYLVLSSTISILRPFVYGAIIAYILYPVCLFFEKCFNNLFKKLKKRKIAYKLSRSISIFLSFIFAIAVIYIILALILPKVYDSIVTIVNKVPVYFDKVYAFVQGFIDNNEGLLKNAENLINTFDSGLTDYLSALGNNLGKIINSVSSGVVGAIIVTKDLLIGCVVAVYLLAGRKNFKLQLKNLIDTFFKKRTARAIKNELSFSNNVISNFISGKILDSVIIGLMCFIGMSIIGIPYPLLVSVFVGITNIIPFFGPFIGAIPSAILILVENPIECLWFIIFVVVLQQFDGNILGPKILGQSTGLSSFWVLFSIILFGGAFGLVGMLAGVPIFAIVYDVCRKALRRYREYKKKNEQKKVVESSLKKLGIEDLEELERIVTKKAESLKDLEEFDEE